MSQPDRKVDFSTPEVTRAARFLTEPPALAEQGPG